MLLRLGHPPASRTVVSVYPVFQLGRSFTFIRTKKRMISAVLVSSIVVHVSRGTFLLQCGLMLAKLLFSYASAISVVVTGSPKGWAMLMAKIGAITCALTDSMITAALLYTFIRLDTKSTFRVSTYNRLSLLRRLSVLCFSSGVAAASTMLLAMILLLNGKSAAPSTFTVVFRVNGSEGSRCDPENTSNVGTDVDSGVSLGHVGCQPFNVTIGIGRARKVYLILERAVTGLLNGKLQRSSSGTFHDSGTPFSKVSTPQLNYPR
ncbi:hypothetical protein DFH08DRAFT_809252 [Mycena albidolilacea]|uniref:Uncharacterized protein n=1 Tax=Mycena albidolilacea TaxID=1033008 RepID=A0AAD7ESW5_9AGAR|nr:hypothetical protein DFH08DRAFT_809252 [Mycena albidolilacea]